MPVPIVFELCDCPAHGIVSAKRTGEFEEGSPRPRFYWQCPGLEGDTGGCSELLTPLGREGSRPPWAEYPDEQLP